MSKNKPFQDIFTPAVLVDEILNYIPLKSDMTILEPSAGDGNMIEQLLRVIDKNDIDNVYITAIEIQEHHTEKLFNRFQDIKNVNIKKFKPLIDVFESFEFG